MPAKSQAQRRFFGMVEHNPAIAKERGIDMPKQSMHDFAATPDKGLPDRAPKRRKFYGEK
jgi:hypothetical protein